MGDTVFRYRSNNIKVLEELAENYVYFTNREKLNDPYDCYPGMIKISEDINLLLDSTFDHDSFISESILSTEELSQRRDYYSKNPELFVGIIKDQIDKILNKLGFACFSKQATNLLMWSHYANFHKGLCIEFDITLDKGFFNNLSPMDYLDEMPKFTYPFKMGDAIFHKALTTKHKGWVNEEELRVVRSEHGRCTFDPKCVKSIYFGIDASPNFIKEVFKATRHYANINYYRSSPLKDKFGLRFNKM